MIVRYNFRSNKPNSKNNQRQLDGELYSRFLFAIVGNHHNGMALTVNSMLAQQGIDPWEEARYLSECPVGEAVCRLVSRINTSPLSFSDVNAAKEVAANLIRVLYFSQQNRSSFFDTPDTVPAGLGGGSRTKPSERDNHGRISISTRRRRLHFLRLLIALAGATTLIVISLTNPKAIYSSAGNSGTSTQTVQAAAIPRAALTK